MNYRDRPRAGFWSMLLCGLRGHDWQLFSTGSAVKGWDSYFCRKCGRLMGISHARYE